MKTKKKAIFLILLSSLSAGIGQLLWKRASQDIASINSIINLFLIAGILAYLLGICFMILAFRDGELSVLHPFLATSYLWVVIASTLIFSTETLSAKRMLGVIIIFVGVSLIGLGGKKNAN